MLHLLKSSFITSLKLFSLFHLSYYSLLTKFYCFCENVEFHESHSDNLDLLEFLS